MHTAGTDGHRASCRSTRSVEREVLDTRRIPRHVRHVPRGPHRGGPVDRDRGVEAEVGRSIVESLGGEIAIDPAPPHLGLVDGVDGEARVAGDRRSFDADVRTVSGEAPHRPGGDRVQPQIATDRGIHDARTVGQPVEATTTESASGRRRRQRRQHAFGPTRGGDDDDRRRPAHRRHEGDVRTIGRELRFGQLAPGDAHLRSDVGCASVRWRGHHGQDTRHMSHETHLRRCAGTGHHVVPTTGEEVYR